MNECTIADLIETIDDSLSPNDFGGYDISRDKAKNLDAALEAARKQAVPANSNIIAAARELIRQADLSLDYRPELRRAISNLHSALAAPAASRAMLPVTDSRLTNEQITAISRAHRNENGTLIYDISFARAIESAVLALATPVAGWVSVEERLPELNVEVIVWCGYRTFGKRTDDQHDPENHSGWVVDIDNGMARAITHWQDAPPAPAVTPTQQEPS